MTTTFRRLADYEQARAAALRSGHNADLELLDGRGRAMRRFTMTSRQEPDERAYRAAMLPPRDNTSARAPRRPSARRRRPWRARPAQATTRPRKLKARGPVKLDYSGPPRPAGAVLEF